MDLTNKNDQQTELDCGCSISDKADQLMQTIDQINDQFGMGTIIYGSAGIGQKIWAMNQQRKTPGYTTVIKGIPTALT